ncbi:BMC domain-containing protein [Clostridium senegalense]|uniref:BMC domain-containing protein n=1 Tax=Clostridium senegalense TaxID=1465809 RepID=UPI001C122477|nr:BMC domain-containing protein [Clostridium senegalense]MBU5226074.1 BMC domain-containing protein [Clostridium senegalense]
MNKSTLGFLETYGFVGAVEGLDTALKSANVELVSCEFVTGGIVTVIITGDVASVKAAIESACTAIERVGTLRNAHVIARADNEVLNIFNKKEESKEESKEEPKSNDIDKDEKETKYEEKENDEKNQPIGIEQLMKMSKEELEALKVQELRTLARKLKEEHKLSLTKKQIKFSKKDQLIEAILNEQ